MAKAFKSDKKTVEQQLKDGPVNKVPAGSGIFHTKGPRSGLVFAPAHNMKAYPNKDAEASIVFGTDRPYDVTSGYGAKGVSGTAAIDLVVGRHSPYTFGPKKLPKGTIVDNSFSADAARIYISQLTDIDKNFGLKGALMPPGKHGMAPPVSGIAIKADGVRIIGREGVKIVTGAGDFEDGELTSGGSKINKAPPIELIAGNYTEARELPGGRFWPAEKINALQPILLGENTISGLNELADVMGHIWAAVFNLSLLQVGANAAIAVDPLRPWVPSALGPAITQEISGVTANLYHARTNLELWKLNFLNPEGYKYICSRNVRAT